MTSEKEEESLKLHEALIYLTAFLRGAAKEIEKSDPNGAEKVYEMFRKTYLRSHYIAMGIASGRLMKRQKSYNGLMVTMNRDYENEL